MLVSTMDMEHPSELAGDERRGEPEERGQLRADVVEAHSVRVSDALGAGGFLEAGTERVLITRRRFSLVVL